MIRRRRVEDLEYGYVCLFYVNHSNQPTIGYVGMGKNADGYHEVFHDNYVDYANVFDYWLSLSDIQANVDTEFA